MTQSSATLNAITVLDSAEKKILSYKQASSKDWFLRILVSQGGCYGFSYSFKFDNTINESEDLKITDASQSNLLLVIDQISLSLIKGSELSFVDELGGSYFTLKNPNAGQSCGCGNSFDIKQ